ncbi:MAG: tetratricopeptide repeat protein [Desulfonatronovibrionaceae bacterium]
MDPLGQKTQQFAQQIESEADSTTNPILEKILNNLRLIGITLGGIILIAAAYSGHRLYQDHQAEQASAKLNEIQALEDPAARAENLAEFTENAPKDVAVAVQLELARALMQTQDFEAAAREFSALGNMDGDLRPIAILGRAKALQLAGKYEEAFNMLVENRDKMPEAYDRALQNMLAFAAEKSGHWDAALSAYQELKAASGMLQEQGKSGFFDYKIQQMQEKVAG